MLAIVMQDRFKGAIMSPRPTPNRSAHPARMARFFHAQPLLLAWRAVNAASAEDGALTAALAQATCAEYNLPAHL